MAVRIRITGWDLRVAVRALALAALAFAVAWLVTAATDEGGIGWSVRAGRTLPMAPACAALGTWLALVPARRRGEVRALEALGRATWENAFGGVAGGAVVALVAAIAMAAAPRVTVDGFFPVVARGASYVYTEGVFVERAHGLRVEPGGALSQEPAAEQDSWNEGLPRHARAAAALATALSGVALPLIAAFVLLARPLPEVGAAPRARGRRDAAPSIARALAAVAASVLVTIVLFQAAAARRIPALVAVLPAAVLLAGAVFRYGGERWRAKG